MWNDLHTKKGELTLTSKCRGITLIPIVDNKLLLNGMVHFLKIKGVQKLRVNIKIQHKQKRLLKFYVSCFLDFEKTFDSPVSICKKVQTIFNIF